MTVSDLTNAGDNIIPSGNITLTGPNSVTGPLHTVSTATGAGSSLTLTAKLNAVPSGLPQGLYLGTVTSTASASSN